MTPDLFVKALWEGARDEEAPVTKTQSVLLGPLTKAIVPGIKDVKGLTGPLMEGLNKSINQRGVLNPYDAAKNMYYPLEDYKKYGAGRVFGAHEMESLGGTPEMTAAVEINRGARRPQWLDTYMPEYGTPVPLTKLGKFNALHNVYPETRGSNVAFFPLDAAAQTEQFGKAHPWNVTRYTKPGSPFGYNLVGPNTYGMYATKDQLPGQRLKLTPEQEGGILSTIHYDNASNVNNWPSMATESGRLNVNALWHQYLNNFYGRSGNPQVIPNSFFARGNVHYPTTLWGYNLPLGMGRTGVPRYHEINRALNLEHTLKPKLVDEISNLGSEWDKAAPRTSIPKELWWGSYPLPSGLSPGR